jgi:hypothetical protein
MADNHPHSKTTLQCLMAYIVNLVIVMQILFWVSQMEYQQAQQQENEDVAAEHIIVIDRARVDCALKIYSNLNPPRVFDVHEAIRQAVISAKPIQRLDRDWAHSRLTEIIGHYRFDGAKVGRSELTEFDRLMSQDQNM